MVLHVAGEVHGFEARLHPFCLPLLFILGVDGQVILAARGQLPPRSSTASTTSYARLGCLGTHFCLGTKHSLIRHVAVFTYGGKHGPVLRRISESQLLEPVPFTRIRVVPQRSTHLLRTVWTMTFDLGASKKEEGPLLEALGVGSPKQIPSG